MKIGCVVMAAGNARRFGENKLAAQLQGGMRMFAVDIIYRQRIAH